MSYDGFDAAYFDVSAGGMGASNGLMAIMGAGDLQPGDQPSYQVCKEIFLSHPLGAKMVESPITMAQSQEREITIPDAPPEVKKAYVDKWQDLECDDHILNVHSQSRVYGIASVVLGIENYPEDKPAEMEKLYKESIFFNVADPLNTSGSLVLSQTTNTPFFQKPRGVRLNGAWFHPSRCQIVMNERPIFIAYTNSAFGFVGRSVYQRALYPLKSFLKSMYADDKIMSKLALIIAKLKAPGAIINQAMMKIAGWKRALLKWAISGQVATIDPDEDVTAIDMTNVGPAGVYARTNILKNIATAADMPAKLLENETMVGGMAEGTEDAKTIAKYIDRIRIKMRPTYLWFNNITQYLAWNPVWYASVIQSKYPEYKDIPWDQAFMKWRADFVAEWPSALIEPPGEAIKRDEIKLEAVIAIVQVLMQYLDPENRATLMQWATDCFGDNENLIPHKLELDWDAVSEHLMEQQEQQAEMAEHALEEPAAGTGAKPKAGGGKVTKFPSFKDSAMTRPQLDQRLARLRALAEGLTPQIREKLTA